jgi:hypothetical protein
MRFGTARYPRFEAAGLWGSVGESHAAASGRHPFVLGMNVPALRARIRDRVRRFGCATTGFAHS